MTWTSRTPVRSRAATAAVVVAVNTSGTRFTPGILRTIASRRMTGVATIAIFWIWSAISRWSVTPPLRSFFACDAVTGRSSRPSTASIARSYNEATIATTSAARSRVKSAIFRAT